MAKTVQEECEGVCKTTIDNYKVSLRVRTIIVAFVSVVALISTGSIAYAKIFSNERGLKIVEEQVKEIPLMKKDISYILLGVDEIKQLIKE